MEFSIFGVPLELSKLDRDSSYGYFYIHVGDPDKGPNLGVQFPLHKSPTPRWGYEALWYDGPLVSFALGRFALLAWEPWTDRGYRYASRKAGMGK